MACELHLLPSRQPGIHALLELPDPFLDPRDFLGNVGIVGILPHLLDLPLELKNGLLEIQYHLCHGRSPVILGKRSGSS